MSEDNLSVYEGFEVALKPAPLLKRTLAYCTDLGIVTVVVYGAMVVGLLIFAGGMLGFTQLLKAGNAFGKGAFLAFLAPFILFLAAVLSLYSIYFIYFEYKKGGQTLGKRVFGLRTVSLRSGPLSLGQVVLRDVFRFLDSLVLTGLVCVLLTHKKQRLGDLVSSTMVVHSAEREKASDHLYVTRSDYQRLSEALQPPALPRKECEEYLQFAFPYLVLRTSQPGEEDLAAREARCRERLGPVSQSLDRASVLLFFAEHCFQTLNRPVA